MRLRTSKNEFLYIAQTAIAEMLGPNPYRKSFLLCPIAGGPGVGAAIVAVVFAPGLAQLWTVPNGVTQIIDAYVWGSGGDSGAAGAVLGGGGGGGGAFSTAGALTAVPGSTWTVNVDAHGNGLTTNIFSPSNVKVAEANSGVTGLLDIRGNGGAVGTGIITAAGGRGATATALAGAGGGGGGAGGNNTTGAGAINQAPGAGGGAAILQGYGKGGSGGGGANSGVNGNAGLGPGGGGGGAGNNGAVVGNGAAGQAVIFYVPSAAQQLVSISQRGDCLLGNGVLNFGGLANYAELICDDEIGTMICEPWYAICGLAGQTFNVIEYSYLPGDVDPAF